MKRGLSFAVALVLLLTLAFPMTASAATAPVYFNSCTDLRDIHPDVTDWNSCCYICSIAMILTTKGIANATPYEVWVNNGRDAYVYWNRIYDAYGVKSEREYFSGTSEQIKAQIIGLCQSHPEGVMLFGTTNWGSHHAVVAFLDDNGSLYFQDPGSSGLTYQKFGSGCFASFTQLEGYRIFTGGPEYSSDKMQWQNHTQTPKDNDFYTYVEAVPQGSGTFTEVGITVWNPHNNNQTVASKKEPINAVTADQLQIWYDVWEETGTKLTGGGNLVYQIYVVFDGVYYHSPVYTVDVLGTHGHDYRNWYVQTPSTCTQAGVQVGSCIYCGLQDSQPAPLADHDYEMAVVEPNCSQPGYTLHVCSECSSSYSDNHEPENDQHVYENDKDTTCELCGYVRKLKVETTPMHRLYNPNSGEHFYTGSLDERDVLVAAGWQYEGIAWNSPVKGGAPVYRLYNPNSGDHHYTMSSDEKDHLVGVGWQYEGIAWNSASSSNVPQYRLYNPNADCGSHHYTGSAEERDYLVSLGWHYEGIGWYGIA